MKHRTTIDDRAYTLNNINSEIDSVSKIVGGCIIIGCNNSHIVSHSIPVMLIKTTNTGDSDATTFTVVNF